MLFIGSGPGLYLFLFLGVHHGGRRPEGRLEGEVHDLLFDRVKGQQQDRDRTLGSNQTLKTPFFKKFLFRFSSQGLEIILKG